MLMDKGYYDYDYEAVKKKPKAQTQEQSEERTQRIMDRFGFGKVKKINKKPLTAEELQAEVMKEERKKRQG